MSRVLLKPWFYKLLHPLLSNTLIYNSQSCVNSLTCMKPPGHANKCACEQLYGCSLRTSPAAVPGNPICTAAREVGSLQPKCRAWEELQPCLRCHSQAVLGAGSWVSGHLRRPAAASLSISPKLPGGQSAKRHLRKKNCGATSYECHMLLSSLCH